MRTDLTIGALSLALSVGCATPNGDEFIGDYEGVLTFEVHYLSPDLPPPADPAPVTLPGRVTINHDAPDGDIAIILDDGSSQCIQQAVVGPDGSVTFRYNACAPDFGPAIAVCDYQPSPDRTQDNTLTHDGTMLTAQLHLYCATGPWSFLETITFVGAREP